MSEYQYVGFRAIDAPVSERNLAYMHAQSSRADFTPWSFDNEYHYGDFRGNSIKMLQRGYDLHLHYANFGTRTLLIRLDTRVSRDREAPGGRAARSPVWQPSSWPGRRAGGQAEECESDAKNAYVRAATSRFLKKMTDTPDEFPQVTPHSMFFLNTASLDSVNDDVSKEAFRGPESEPGA